MPLHYPSDTEADFFVLDREADRFRLKEPAALYRGRAEFRELAAPSGPITCAPKRWFHGKAGDDNGVT